MGRKIAVVLFNLGGPDKPASVQPFLKNLFRDPAIIRAPLPIRWLLARLISRTRAPAVIKNYAMMDAGGGSPCSAKPSFRPGRWKPSWQKPYPVTTSNALLRCATGTRSQKKLRPT